MARRDSRRRAGGYVACAVCEGPRDRRDFDAAVDGGGVADEERSAEQIADQTRSQSVERRPEKRPSTGPEKDQDTNWRDANVKGPEAEEADCDDQEERLYDVENAALPRRRKHKRNHQAPRRALPRRIATYVKGSSGA
ncbi:hypothetical protein E4U40_005557 [Claviceps sp. LM458 group G5]|nr:hypothetical protein E4U40_005557 [Claviceps sp. LM458 group G5]